ANDRKGQSKLWAVGQHVRVTGDSTSERAVSKKAYSTRLVNSSTRLILVLILGLPATLWAQRQQASWSDLRGLRAGQGIEVIESNMKHHSGEFIAVTDEILTFQESGSDLSIKRVDIVRVSTSSAPTRGEHALIGLVVGGAIGAGIGAVAGSSGSKTGWFNFNTRGIGALIGVAIGAPSGALVGAVIPARTTVYRAAPGTYHPTTMSR